MCASAGLWGLRQLPYCRHNSQRRRISASLEAAKQDSVLEAGRQSRPRQAKRVKVKRGPPRPDKQPQRGQRGAQPDREQEQRQHGQQQLHWQVAPQSSVHGEAGADGSGGAKPRQLPRTWSIRLGDSLFQRKLADARTVEDLYELARDAESLEPAAVATLPGALLAMYARREYAERRAVLQHPIFDMLAKPWALQPAELEPEAAMRLLSALVQLDAWQPGSHRDLLECLRRTVEPLAQRLARQADAFSPTDMCQVLQLCNSSSMLREGGHHLGLAALSAAVQKLHAFDAGRIAELAQLCVSTNLRYNIRDLRAFGAVVGRALELLAHDPQPGTVASVAQACALWPHMTPADNHVLADAACRALPACSPDELRSIILAAGSIPLRDPQLMAAVERRLQEVMPACRASHLSNALWGFVRARHQPNRQLMQEVANQAMLRISTFNLATTCQMLVGLAKLRFRPPGALLEALSLHVEMQPVAFSPQQLTELLWSLGSLGYAPSNLDVYLKIAQELMPQFNSIDICQTMTGLARLGTAPPGLLQAVVQRSWQQLDAFSAQGLANLAYSFAKLDHCPSLLLDALAGQLPRRRRELNRRDVCDLLWAFARLQHRSAPQAIDTLLDVAERELAKGDSRGWLPRDYCILAWSMAQLGMGRPRMLALLQARTALLVGQMGPQDVANLLWSFAMLQQPLPPEYLELYWARTAALVPELAAQQDASHLSHILWGAAQYQHFPGEAVMAAAAATAERDLQSCTASTISILAYAFGRLRWHPGEAALANIAAEVVARPQVFVAMDWAAILQGMTRLMHCPGALYDLLWAQVSAGNVGLDHDLLSTAVWSMAHFPQASASTFAAFMQRAARLPPDLDERSVRKVYQALELGLDCATMHAALWSLLCHGPGRSCLQACTAVQAAALPASNGTVAATPPATPPLQAYMLAQARAAAGAGRAPPPLPAAFQERARASRWGLTSPFSTSPLLSEVVAALEACGLAPEMGPLVGHMVLDLRLPSPGRKIAVEVAGAGKTLRNRAAPSARGASRVQLLEAWGWTVLQVPHKTWDALPDAEAKQLYVQDLVRPVLPLPAMAPAAAAAV